MKRMTVYPRQPQLTAVTLVLGYLLTGSPVFAEQTTGVDALSQLSSADLDTTRPLGRTFLQALFPEQATSCHKPDVANLPFDNLCNWYSDPNSEDPWPDLMVAMNNNQIVSVVTVDADRLDSKIWLCDPKGEQSQATICYPLKIDAKVQQGWSEAWQQYFDSVN